MRVEHIVAVGYLLEMPSPVVNVKHDGSVDIVWENEFFNFTVFTKKDYPQARRFSYYAAWTDGSLNFSGKARLHTLNGLFLVMRDFLAT